MASSVTVENNEIQGLTISAQIDASHFIETPDEQNNVDSISLVVSSFETDARSSAIDIPSYQLLPCEFLRHITRTRALQALESEAQSLPRGLPRRFKAAIKATMGAEDYYNPVFAPQLPYDQETCEQLCAAKYWLPKCGCYVSKIDGNTLDLQRTWLFVKKVAPIVQPIGYTLRRDVFSECNCFKKCNQYRFRVVGQDKIRFGCW